MNLIGIDISIDSTGMSIFRDDEVIFLNFTVQKRNAGWIKKTMEAIDYEFINYTYKDIDNYTESEIMKLREFDHVTDLIYEKIKGNINKKEKTIIAIEGYNYRLKNTNSIIDIVTFSTLLRLKILQLPRLDKLIIISPMTVKSKTAELVYGFELSPKAKNKKINKNKEGVAGGDFDKKDMMKALIELNGEDKLSKVLEKYKCDLLKLKNVPKPWDDIIDSFFIMKTLMM
jgi:hypothetical protein